MTKHYRKSPSGAKRSLRCPGSLTIECPDLPESAYAAEGTEAHGLGERAVREGRPPAGLTDNAEMAAAVDHYYRHCTGLVALAQMLGDPHVALEETIESGQVADHGGTIDFLLVCGEHAWVVDYKHGVGVVVEAEGNEQLLCYAALVLERHPGVTRFDLTIVQPRTPGPAVDTWRVTAEEVRDFRASAVERWAETDVFSAGDHCRWCPAKTRCEHLHQLTLETARTEFDDLAAAGPSTYAERLARLWRVAPAIRSLLDEVPARLIALAKEGEPLPGLKVVAGYGKRQWAHDEQTVLKRLKSRRVAKRDATVTRLLSPAQLERAGHGDALKDLVKKPAGGPTVVEARDKRTPFHWSSPDEDFDTLDVT